MRFKLATLPALLIAGAAVANGDGQRDATDPKAKAPAVNYRSAFEGYRPYADQELRDWRKSNAEVRDAAQKPAPKSAKPHGGHK